ncbi:MAG: hypothetical protein DWQ07_20165 [Chloroflexi bacterium]|nr:MAG: hypothetical protein DWQ07_20165 [Chloroflexota bacterium]MBL1194397.1 hypothetical protein [Chloroflexota bacterium]NOH11685.1 hypothetical protein [Chloroflexota bacterium]
MSPKELVQIEKTSINSYADWQYAKTIVDNYLAKCKQVLASPDGSEMRILLELLDEAHEVEQKAYKKYTNAINAWNKSFLTDPDRIGDTKVKDVFVS